jgi:hypothetical protein
MDKTREGDKQSESFLRVSTRLFKETRITCNYYQSSRAFTKIYQEQTLKLKKSTY